MIKRFVKRTARPFTGRLFARIEARIDARLAPLTDELQAVRSERRAVLGRLASVVIEV